MRMKEVVAVAEGPQTRRDLVSKKVDVWIDGNVPIEIPLCEKEAEREKLGRNWLIQPSPERNWESREMYQQTI